MRRLAARARLLLHVVALFVSTELALRRLPLKSICEMRGILFGDEVIADSSLRRLSGVSPRAALRATIMVSRRWPFGDTCLRRCLVLAQLLPAGVPRLVIGVRRDENDEFAAHAWLEIDNQSIDPSSTIFGRLDVA